MDGFDHEARRVVGHDPLIGRVGNPLALRAAADVAEGPGRRGGELPARLGAGARVVPAHELDQLGDRGRA